MGQRLRVTRAIRGTVDDDVVQLVSRTPPVVKK